MQWNRHDNIEFLAEPILKFDVVVPVQIDKKSSNLKPPKEAFFLVQIAVAIAATLTLEQPAAASARAQASRVAPVVTMSSTTK